MGLLQKGLRKRHPLGPLVALKVNQAKNLLLGRKFFGQPNA
jgi:hypothetical protein